jgi:hypothetical protein
MSQVTNEIRFAPEIECAVPRIALQEKGWIVGGYHSPIQIPDPDHTGVGAFGIQSDSSIRPTGTQSRNGCVMVEIAPMDVLHGAEGFAKIDALLATLRSMGAKINRSCGLHINVSHPKLSKPGILNRLIALFSRYEKAFWAVNGSKTREDTNNRPGGHSWCRSIKRSYKDRGYDDLRSISQIASGYNERYHALNLTNMIRRSPERRRVEFRCFAPTLNTVKLNAYVRLCMALCEAAIVSKMKPDWDLVKGERDAAWPDGVYTLRRLFYGPIRWYHSRPDLGPNPTDPNQDARYKALGILGDDMANGLDKSARILFKMARKYDESRGHTVFPEVVQHYATF